jgi:ABC-type glycerol-3-phosphate transport system substrate-binding protein
MGPRLTRAGVMLGLRLGAVTCGGGDPDTGTRPAVPAITFQVAGDPEETRVYKELAENYERDTGCG